VASLWVDASGGGSCVRSASAVAYSHASACKSFQAAYSAASCGDTVGVVAGSYPSQSISSGSKSCSQSSQVLFTPVPGGSCDDLSKTSMPALSLSVSYVSVECLTAYDGSSSGAQCSGIGGSSGQHSSIVWDSLDHVALRCAFFDSDNMAV